MKPVSNPAAFSQCPFRVMAGGWLLFLPLGVSVSRKKFVGYYPTNPLSECFDRKNLFIIDEDISRIFVTDKFKQRVEDAGLTAFDFSVEIELS
ncbi:hypothetical protein [Morganella sp. GD04133]|uniref:hypothetical protein n=1 Tax=Morganella sp. GD04133 TaxID=2975435 RepID=UPI00244D5AAA|nr:hypothetical protein [Morganella sp. GD04133]MDH0353887.1 hypothetical protein [Morganella sp. GD04133]